jgi:hypothetical protein
MKNKDDIDIDEIREIRDFLKQQFLQAKADSKELSKVNSNNVHIHNLKQLVQLKAVNSASAYLNAVSMLQEANKLERLSSLKEKKNPSPPDP